jgi:membrane protein insertase Oxa1/YidC/SpoIIIJ
MGRTVPPFSIAAEWAKSKRERKMFDEMMSLSRLYNVAGIGACKPVLIQPILMSIISEHYKQLEILRKCAMDINEDDF